ncbi:hypothetical protein AHiyo8_45370 [Arthrobacter sp. Hiyo8]|nr:hypothetical protein AHiyo8_45370 [Arthrobacter sp. Hiyo8]
MAAAGATWRLKELVGEPIAKEILLAGAVLRAEEALRINLITQIHEAPVLMEAATTLPTGSAGRTPWPCGSPSPCSTLRPRLTP